MPCNVHVAQDSNGKLLHLIAEVENGKSKDPTPFVQTTEGVESMATGKDLLQGTLTHRFTGRYLGNKTEYIKSVHEAKYDGKHKKRLLKRAGVTNIAKDFGAVVAVGGGVAAGLTGVQVAYLWYQFSRDGVIDAQEATRMGLELLEFNSIPAAIKDVWAATHDGVPGMDLLKPAEKPTQLENVIFQDRELEVEGTSEVIDEAVGEAAGEGLCGIVGTIIECVLQ